MPFCLSAEKADYPWLNGKHLPWIEKLEALKAAMDNELSGSASADNHVDKDDDAWRCTYNNILSFFLSLSLSNSQLAHTKNSSQVVFTVALFVLHPKLFQHGQMYSHQTSGAIRTV